MSTSTSKPQHSCKIYIIQGYMSPSNNKFLWKMNIQIAWILQICLVWNTFIGKFLFWRYVCMKIWNFHLLFSAKQLWTITIFQFCIKSKLIKIFEFCLLHFVKWFFFFCTMKYNTSICQQQQQKIHHTWVFSAPSHVIWMLIWLGNYLLLVQHCTGWNPNVQLSVSKTMATFENE